MKSAMEELESAVLSLPDHARASLAERLIASLDDPSTEEDPADVDKAWAAEIARRIAAYRAGEIEALPAEEVMREAQSRLKS